MISGGIDINSLKYVKILDEKFGKDPLKWNLDKCSQNKKKQIPEKYLFNFALQILFLRFRIYFWRRYNYIK